MSFSITFLSDRPAWLEKQESLAEVIIGTFREQITVPLEFWTKNDYREHWSHSLHELTNSVSPVSNVALVTEMHNPRTANFIKYWALYRKPGDSVVHVQEHILFLDKLTEPFSVDNLSQYVEQRESITAEGDNISEWTLSIEDIQAWAEKLDSLKTQ